MKIECFRWASNTLNLYVCATTQRWVITCLSLETPPKLNGPKILLASVIHKAQNGKMLVGLARPSVITYWSTVHLGYPR